MAKRFFYVCAGLVCLALAYHLGVTNSNAQAASGNRIRMLSATGTTAWVVTEGDDIYLIKGDTTTAAARGDGWSRFHLANLH